MEGFASDTLAPKTVLRVGQQLVSLNGMYRLVYQSDGNLAGYRTTPTHDECIEPFWTSGTPSSQPDRVVLQDDGNLVCHDTICSDYYWSSNTAGRGRGPYKLVMQSDRNICIYDVNDSLTWSSNTPSTEAPKTQLANEEGLLANQHIVSPNGLYRLLYQADGNLVGCRRGQSTAPYPFWSSGRSVAGPGQAVMGGDGNLTCYDGNGKQYFSTKTAGKGKAPFRLVMQNDRNICIYDSKDTVTWTSKTQAPSAFSNTLGDNQQLDPNFELVSANGLFRLVYQFDGNLVGYPRRGRGCTIPFWETGKLNDYPGKVIMQSDGNLVCYNDDNYPYFETNTRRIGSGPYKLVMQDDRNICLIDAKGVVTWSSRTSIQ